LLLAALEESLEQPPGLEPGMIADDPLPPATWLLQKLNQQILGLRALPVVRGLQPASESSDAFQGCPIVAGSAMPVQPDNFPEKGRRLGME